MREMIQEAVKETVNGKIAALDKKIDDHMNDIKPFMQGISGVKVLASGLGWLAGIAVAYATIKGFLSTKF